MLKYYVTPRYTVLCSMEKNYKRTNLYIIDSDLYDWAKRYSTFKGYDSVSEYIFDLIKKDKEGQSIG